MSHENPVEQRLDEIDEVLRTLILFNMNATAVIGRRLASGNQAMADAIAKDLNDLKSVSIQNANKELHDQFIGNLITMITVKA